MSAGNGDDARPRLRQEAVFRGGRSRVQRVCPHLLRVYRRASRKAGAGQFSRRRRRGFLSRRRCRSHGLARWNQGGDHSDELGAGRRRHSRCIVFHCEISPKNGSRLTQGPISTRVPPPASFTHAFLFSEQGRAGDETRLSRPGAARSRAFPPGAPRPPGH